MFDLMSPNLEKIALEDARDIAAAAGNAEVHPEHLLLAVLAKEDCVATKIISKKVNPKDVTSKVIDRLDKEFKPAASVPEKLPFSDTAKKAIEGSHQEAMNLGYETIGTEHMVLSILANYEPLRTLLKEKFEITYGWMLEMVGRAPSDAPTDATGGIPTGKKTVKVSPIMAGVFFEAGMSERDIETALFAIEQIKGVVFSQAMRTPASRTPTIGG